MELILISIVGTAALLIAELADFLRGDRARERRPAIRPVLHGLGRTFATQTVTVPVPTAHRR